MIDIDKLTEAQVRYVLNDVIEGMRISVGVETTDYYLQVVGNQAVTHNKLTMRKVTMIKKIKIVDKWGMYITILRDTTTGNTYSVTFHKEGTVDACGEVCIHDTICFKDDIGDTASIWTHADVYEVVEED